MSIGLPDPDPGAKSSSNPVLFGAVKRSGNPFFEDLLDLYMEFYGSGTDFGAIY